MTLESLRPDVGLNDEDLVVPEASESFVSTPYVEEVTNRALVYLRAGYPVHLAGPSGTGKTTMAFHLAALWGRPVTLIHGNDEFSVSDLIGTNDAGYRRSKVVDNYIHSVVRTEEEMRQMWVDNRLTTACRNGDTLIYDEFNRSRPEANNVLLSVMSEGILNLPGLRTAGEGYLDVGGDFRAIFTSNPEEYAGTHKTQDALADRMITIRLNPPDRDTEIEIVKAKAGIDEFEAGHIVDIIRELRGSGENKTRPTLRAGIAIGKILGMVDGRARFGDRFFHGVCYDVVSTESAKVLHDGQSIFHQLVDSVIKQVCPPVGAQPRDDAANAQAQVKVKAVNAAFATKLNAFRS
ncbi:gas vesicle protein GvpN [Lamprobacter modestohalophilus]|uniref:gas vesicle protein GvpN n=1 Tax=Lamprobacter modestohalophilus TaxID=1064514 RepID=UPI002ADED538|nr:gas vesicle protein GvpN [Lamprobacter modestohalophilus]MEA1050658.1 gas vesicle protein GvpN [Lamprobacter modestohalophilus]